MQSQAVSVSEYLDELTNDRRISIQTVRKVILDNLPLGYQETMNWGMIAYEVPLDRYPHTYNKKPLMYAALASQKRHMAVYLSGIYSNEVLRQQFEADYAASGKRMDMGKSCVRFTKIDHLPLDLIGRVIAALSVDEFIAITEKCRRR